MTATLSNYLYVPRELVRPHHLAAYSYWLQDPYEKQRYRLDTCFEHEFDSYAFPRGDLGKIRKLFETHVEDRRVANPHGYRLRFTGTLKSDQVDAIRRWVEVGYGQIQAPPRWGKTVVMTALMCKLRQRTMMLAHIEDLCHQFEETIRKFTNINQLEDEHGIRLCGVLKEWDDFFPIVTISTYQCFAVSKRGRSVLEQHRDDFGLVMVDEAHRCKTELFREVVERTTAAYRCGVTATPTRKDGLHVVVNDTLGPVTAVGRGEQLPVRYTWSHTGIEVQPFGRWSTLYNRLSKMKRRNKMIAKQVVQDVRDGHFVLVTTERLAHMDELGYQIQKIDPDITVGYLSGKTKDREQFRAKAKRGDYQVVIAMNKIVELGYNIPRWSCLHNTLPMTNKQNWYQRVSRIRTKMEPAFDGDDYVKPHPLARIWLDSNDRAIWAYRAVVKSEMDRLGFECLNPDKPKTKMKRTGTVTWVSKNS